jgi:glycerol-3-phosphate dehydrogenase
VRDSITHRVSLLGADGFEARTNQRVHLARRSGLHVARVDHLLGRYGDLVDDLLALIGRRPELVAPLEDAEDYLAAEVVYAVTHEGARHLDDVLTRRTRISIETFDRGVGAAPVVARLMAAELGWDDARTADEVDHYLRRVEAERQSQTMATDQEADEARVRARDIV